MSNVQRGSGSLIATTRRSPRRRKWKPLSTSITIGSSSGSPASGEELDALAGEHDLGGGRELLAHAAHCARRGAGGEVTSLGDDDVVRAEQREVVRDARADRAGAGDDYPGHSATIRFTSVSSSS